MTDRTADHPRHPASLSARLLLGSAGALANPLVLLRAVVVDILDSAEAATLDRALSPEQP